jgi:intein-encoded DNA endonuclease-like protein
MVNGEALIELGKLEQSTAKIEKGIMRLRKALGMCMKQGQRQFEKEIEVQINKANKIKWYKENELGHIDKM